jgi:hypothetical protein
MSEDMPFRGFRRFVAGIRSFNFCLRRHGLKIFDHLVVSFSIVSYLKNHYYFKSLLSRMGYVCPCNTTSVGLPCGLVSFVISHLFRCWLFHTFPFINIVLFRSYHISNLFCFHFVILARMDLGSHISRSSDSAGDSSSSTGSITPLSGPANSGSSSEVTSPMLQDIWAELSSLKLVLASHEHTLVERSNQLSRLMGELDSKDHQLALANRQIQLQDHRIAELEAKLADVYKGQMQEAHGEHARVRLLVDTERECRQLHRKCRFWRSWALAKPHISSDASRGKHLG